MASPAAPRVAAALRVDEAPSELDPASKPALCSAPRPATLSALFAALSDGRPHRLDRLAAVVGASAPADLPHALEALRAAGVALSWTADTVRSPPSTVLDAVAIERWLADERARQATWDVRVVWSTASTNSELMEEVRRGDGTARPSLLVAETQHAGRGRLGRRWSSAPGTSLTMSMAVRLPRPLSALDGVTLVCGLATQHVLSADGVPARLKWPNDVLVDGAKLAGILVEAHAGRDGTTLVVGVGINVAGPVASTASAGGFRRTDLERCGAASLDRNRLAARIAQAVVRDLSTFATLGFAPFAADWNAIDAFAGVPVTVGSDDPLRDPASVVSGIARGVDDTGALRIETADGLRRIIAGDVSLRPVAS